LDRECLGYHLEKVIPQLQTSRLFLHPLGLADAQQAQLLFPHWEIVRYLSNTVPWPYPPDGAYTFYRDAVLPAMDRGDEWHWTLRLKTEPDQLIGGVALRKGENINRGFWLGLPWRPLALRARRNAGRVCCRLVPVISVCFRHCLKNPAFASNHLQG